MRKAVLALTGVLILMVSLHAMDLESGLDLSGGVKTGVMIKNRDYGGKLGDLALGLEHKYPLTFFFASEENEARNGEAWINLGYSHVEEGVGNFGLRMGMWAHGDISSYSDVLHVGDHYLWANFFKDRLRFIGGQGGGTPITSGGWINADWLSYTGLRLFWVDPSGLSAGINFPDPGEDGIKPVNYLSLLSAGISYTYTNWWFSVQFSNSPIYDDTESNYYGGLHRPAEQDPIAMAGNIAYGMGVNNLYAGKGFFTIEGLITNLGEDEEEGLGDYTISPVQTTFALKTGGPISEKVYLEMKGKYTISQGDSEDFSWAVYWGKLELKPYVSFQAFKHLGFQLSVYGAWYFNSYYLALESNDVYQFSAGQVPGFPSLRDYLSPYYLEVEPGITLKLGSAELVIGYSGYFSRDHVENTVYLDCKWSF